MSLFKKNKINKNNNNSDYEIIKLYFVILGMASVGKTAITVQYVKQHWVEEYDPTIEDQYNRSLVIDNQNYNLNILDTAGMDDFSAIRDQYLKSANGFLITYDITDRVSFEKTFELVDQIKFCKDVDTFPMVLIANKNDITDPTQRKVSQVEGIDLGKFYNCPFIETSAKTRENIELAFYSLVKEVERFSTLEKLNKNNNNKKNKKSKENNNNNNNDDDNNDDSDSGDGDGGVPSATSSSDNKKFKKSFKEKIFNKIKCIGQADN